MRAADPGAKAIVFSQFTSMLELIQFRLDMVGGEGFFAVKARGGKWGGGIG